MVLFQLNYNSLCDDRANETLSHQLILLTLAHSYTKNSLDRSEALEQSELQ